MSAPRAVAASFALLVVSASLTACGGPSVSAHAHCKTKPYVAGDEPESVRRSLLLVDLSSNREAARRAIVEAIRPTIAAAIEAGGIVRLVVSGGSGQPMQVSSCLDGKEVLHTDYKNATRERNERAAAVAGIEGDVEALVKQTKIGSRSDVTNLIAQARGQLAEVDRLDGGGAKPAPSQVVLVSDLNSPVTRGDCMSVAGLPASEPAANALVERCIALHQYRPLPRGVELHVIRPELTEADSNASRMGGFLATSLCLRISGRERSCPNRGA